MTPTEIIADLDHALAEAGEDVRLQRLTGTQLIPFGVDCRAFVRGYQPHELVGGIKQQDSKVILSPTEITKAGWPGAGTTPDTGDRRVPRSNDRCFIARKPRTVEAAVGIFVQNVLVRIEMQVRG